MHGLKSLLVETCKNDSLQIGNSNNTNYTHLKLKVITNDVKKLLFNQIDISNNK